MIKNSKTVARINEVDIVLIHDGEKRIAVKPICEALGVSHEVQIRKIKEHPILSSTMTIMVTVGADGKDREMVTIPYKFVFGWLFSIDARKVKPEAAEAVLKYQLECYNALYRHFIEHSSFLEQKQDAISARLDNYQIIQKQFKTAKDRLSVSKKDLNQVRAVSFDDWKIDNTALITDLEAKEEEANHAN